jgi:signal transduction histidine kinase
VRTIEEMYAALEHELRSPVGAALLHARLAALQLRDSDNRELPLAALTTVIQEIARLDAILSRLARVSTPLVSRRPLDLARAIPAIIHRLALAEPQLRWLAVVHLRGDLRGRWDGAALEEVIGNLVDNALKFGEGGGPIDVTAVRDGELVRISVHDDGIGIAPRDQSRIFERFERAVPPRTYRGLGLGLWVARALVEAQCGTIAVTSALGRGATFTVTLPVERPPRARGRGAGALPRA